MPPGNSVKCVAAGEAAPAYFCGAAWGRGSDSDGPRIKGCSENALRAFRPTSQIAAKVASALERVRKNLYLHTEQAAFPAWFDGRFLRDETVSNVPRGFRRQVRILPG